MSYESECEVREAAAELAEELAEARAAHALAERLEAEAETLWDEVRASASVPFVRKAAEAATEAAEAARETADEYGPLPDGDCDPPGPDYAPDDHPLNVRGMTYRDSPE